jgi:hypothetical protein
MTAVDTIKEAVLGVPFDPGKQPSRQGVVRAFAEMQKQMEAAQAGAFVKDTKESLDAFTNAPLSAMAWVVSDPTNSLNGIYEYLGGNWIRRADIPQFVVYGMNTGVGTADAIEVETDLPFPVEDGRALLMFPVIETNTTQPTVSVNGGAPLPLISASGQAVTGGGLLPGMTITGYVSNGRLRLLSDQATAVLVAQAEAAAAAAADYANFALSNWIVNSFAGDGSTVEFELSIEPGIKQNTNVYIDSIYQYKSSYSVVGKQLIFSEAPPGNGVDNNIEVNFGNSAEIDIGVPSDGSVSRPKLDSSIFSNLVEVLDPNNENSLLNPKNASYLIDSKLTDLGAEFTDFEIGFSASGGSATFSVLNKDGDTPSVEVPVTFKFPADNGGFVTRTLSEACQIVISSGSTLGAFSEQAFRAWLVVFDDDGTLVPAVINCRKSVTSQNYDIKSLRNGFSSTTVAEGGAGAADDAHVFYSANALSVARKYLIIGYVDYDAGLTTAGTWTAATRFVTHSKGDALPGDVVQQIIATSSSAYNTTSTTYGSIPETVRNFVPLRPSSVLSMRATAGVRVNAATSGNPMAQGRFFKNDVGIGPVSTNGLASGSGGINIQFNGSMAIAFSAIAGAAAKYELRACVLVAGTGVLIDNAHFTVEEIFS